MRGRRPSAARLWLELEAEARDVATKDETSTEPLAHECASQRRRIRPQRPVPLRRPGSRIPIPSEGERPRTLAVLGLTRGYSAARGGQNPGRRKLEARARDATSNEVREERRRPYRLSGVWHRAHRHRS